MKAASKPPLLTRFGDSPGLGVGVGARVPAKEGVRLGVEVEVTEGVLVGSGVELREGVIVGVGVDVGEGVDVGSATRMEALYWLLPSFSSDMVPSQSTHTVRALWPTSPRDRV
jgi:hypothetical protein